MTDQAKLSCSLLTISCSLMLSHAAHFVSSGSSEHVPKTRDYSVIYERNPFGLRPLPPPKTNFVAKPPQDQILLTGITSIGRERAYFMSKPSPGRLPHYYCLGVGEGKDTLEVLDIDLVAKTVRVRHAGEELVMNFWANGVKPVPTIGPGSLKTNARSASLPGSLGTTTSNSRLRMIPTRTVRTPSIP